MPTKLKKNIERETSAFAREIGRNREIIVGIRPPGIVTVRLKGVRGVYKIDAEILYAIAIKRFANDIENRTKQLKKSGMRITSARSQARKELQATLKD